MNILFTCAGRRKYLVDYFSSELDTKGRLIGADMSLTAPALASCDARYQVPSVYNEEYINQLLRICKKEAINLLIPLNDMELPFLAESRERFINIGTTLVLGDKRCIDICSDKWLTVEFAYNLGIPTPKSYLTLQEAEVDLNTSQVFFPLIVKPRWGSASFGLHIVHSIQELRDAFNICINSFKESYLANFAQSHQVVIIQDYIEGKEYGVDIINNLNGEYKGAIAKQKLSMRSGETDKAITVDPSNFTKFSEKISNNLKHVGNLDCDFLERDGVFYLLEMNPRFGGGYPFTHEAGANVVKSLLASYKKEQSPPLKYEIGRTFAKTDSIISVDY